MKRERGKSTEITFVHWCKSKGYYCIRLQVDSGRDYLTKRVPADYIVLTDTHTLFIELKEVSGNNFPFKNLRQHKKLHDIHYSSADNVLSIILINFYDLNKLAVLPLHYYNSLYNGSKKSFISINDIDNRYLTTWKHLKINSF